MFLILFAPLLLWLKIESFSEGFNEIYEFFFRAFKIPTRRVFYITNKRVNHLSVFLTPLLFYRFAIYCCFVLINGLQFVLCISQQGLCGIRDKALAILVFSVQYRSEEMASLHRSCLTAGPVAYMEGIFRAMAERGVIRADDPQTLALTFYAPLWLLVCACDGPEDRARGRLLLEAHIDRFIRETSAEF